MTFTTASTAPKAGNFRENRLLQALVAGYLVVWIVLALSPIDRQDWLLGNLLAVTWVLVLTTTYRRFPFSDLSYVLITLFMMLHAIGAHYTYTKVPFGFWLKDIFELSRNHFDRIVHFAFVLLLAYPAYELVVRAANARKGWAAVLAMLTAISMSGLFEVLESWVAQIVSPELGAAYLGTQGDEWDAQKDMTMAISGVLIAMGLIYLIPRVAPHRAEIARN
jgi:putative membrane protein